jgi:hypothetical protein
MELELYRLRFIKFKNVFEQQGSVETFQPFCDDFNNKYGSTFDYVQLCNKLQRMFAKYEAVAKEVAVGNLSITSKEALQMSRLKKIREEGIIDEEDSVMLEPSTALNDSAAINPGFDRGDAMHIDSQLSVDDELIAEALAHGLSPSILLRTSDYSRSIPEYASTEQDFPQLRRDRPDFDKSRIEVGMQRDHDSWPVEWKVSIVYLRLESYGAVPPNAYEDYLWTRIAYDFNAQFQTEISAERICTFFYDLKREIASFLQTTASLAPYAPFFKQLGQGNPSLYLLRTLIYRIFGRRNRRGAAIRL